MAGKFNRYLSKTINMLDSVHGKTSKEWATKARVLNEAKVTGLTATRASRKAKVSNGRTFQNRVKLGVGGGVALTGGLLGLHKYMQYQNNKILARIDKMYNKQ